MDRKVMFFLSLKIKENRVFQLQDWNEKVIKINLHIYIGQKFYDNSSHLVQKEAGLHSLFLWHTVVNYKKKNNNSNAPRNCKIRSKNFACHSTTIKQLTFSYFFMFSLSVICNQSANILLAPFHWLQFSPFRTFIFFL